MASSPQLLLGRPVGGLNDMLCQIDNACRYAEQFGRLVRGVVPFTDDDRLWPRVMTAMPA